MALGKRAWRWRKRAWRGAIVKVARGNTKLNAHFYSAASLWYQIPVTLPDTTSSHIILTPSPTPKIRVPGGEQLVPLLTTLVCRGPGSNPVPPDPRADTLPTELPRPVGLCWIGSKNL